MTNKLINIDKISVIMKDLGAKKIIVKPLANNDNSKQQIYLGADFSVMQGIPVGELKSAGMSKKGARFKATLNLFWINTDSCKEQAHGSQIILYPNYPEIRLSGIIKGCSIAPSHLMQPPTKEERINRCDKNRYLILGICKDMVFAYMSSWEDALSIELRELIDKNLMNPVFSVFYEYYSNIKDSRSDLITRLKEIYSYGFIKSQRLDKNGNVIEYRARNGAGFTLESLFGIIPNGRSGPDFSGWELKTHSGRVVTLMTPEPDKGEYIENLHKFMSDYASNKKEDRVDFASIHKIGLLNEKTKLTLYLEGYDFDKKKIIDPDGGLVLRSINGNIAAGWNFGKLLDHWKRKHSKTCFVSYDVKNGDFPYYKFGPQIVLATGANLNKFISALESSKIYYDPGINIKYQEGLSKVKKRNQFRIKWKDVLSIYDKAESLDLNES
ncbi:MvaI/BcnI family restriction endonuclease [Photorhabdus bodei]|uniref:MvaI/BcnI family restriction endonuclease n=1 Tax=Photorhabdus bodei TaxID=2029681 RepID=UPI001961BA4E|nr:MvaI/BcnI family restriction endonuclease [Photorhabdus bodei]